MLSKKLVTGGKRRRSSSRRVKRSSKSRSKIRRGRSSRSRAKPKTRKKRKMNEFFKLMLNAKRKGLDSFTYKDNIYVGKPHPKLGMIYKKK